MGHKTNHIKSRLACLYAVFIAFLSTLKVLAKECHDTPESFSLFTKAQSFWPSFRIPRIFLSLSSAFAFAVPMNKWSGFVHSGLSHLWQTCMPCGISPKCNIQDMRLAGAFSCIPPNLSIPYPNGCFAPFHFQQPSVFMTLAQNLSDRGFVRGMFNTRNVAMTTL